MSINNDFVLENKSNKEKLEKYLMGQIMKETKGKVDPIITKKILNDILND